MTQPAVFFGPNMVGDDPVRDFSKNVMFIVSTTFFGVIRPVYWTFAAITVARWMGVEI